MLLRPVWTSFAVASTRSPTLTGRENLTFPTYAVGPKPFDGTGVSGFVDPLQHAATADVHTVFDHAAGAGPGGRLRRRLELPNRAGATAAVSCAWHPLGCHAVKPQANVRDRNGITAAVASSVAVRPARFSLSQVPKFSAVAGRR
jgi:hypothetical protein